MTDEQITLNASQYCDTMNDKNEDIKLIRFASYIAGATTTKDIIEKENADLKEQNKKLLESCEGATMMYEDLCKAKELLRFWTNDFYDGFNHSNKYEDRHKALVETQQFLKEIEK